MHETTDLRKKTKAELIADVISLRKEQFNLRMQAGSGATVKTHRFKEIRRLIARIKTVIAEASTKEG